MTSPTYCVGCGLLKTSSYCRWCDQDTGTATESDDTSRHLRPSKFLPIIGIVGMMVLVFLVAATYLLGLYIGAWQ